MTWLFYAFTLGPAVAPRGSGFQPRLLWQHLAIAIWGVGRGWKPLPLRRA